MSPSAALAPRVTGRFREEDRAMAIRVGINGFGRIGRQVFKAIRERHKGRLEVAAINDLMDPNINAHLLKYDTNYGRFPGTVEVMDGGMSVDGDFVKVFAERE